MALIWVIDNQRGRRNINELTNCYLIGKRYNTEKLGAVGRPKYSSNFKITGNISAENNKKSQQSAIYNEKFTLALEDIETKTVS
jgi:hypothetical protein